MNILWLTNIPLPEASQLIEEQPSPFGGWLINAANLISSEDNIKLSVAFPSKKSLKWMKLEGDKINYYSFYPIKENQEKIKNYSTNLESVLKSANPDVVHIFGTELAHSIAMINVCEKLGIKTVVSIQGLVSVISKHIDANLPFHVIYGRTFRNILRNDHVNGLKSIFINRGKDEVNVIKKTKHVIGRTTWDKACVKQINPQVKYHHCNETLRSEFYKHSWDISNCEKYSIFLSQGQYPIKGFHYLLEALPIILKKFPGAKLYISGKNVTKKDNIKDRILLTYYGKYLIKLIRKYKLENHIEFTGVLNEKEMCNRFLKTHVFISPSTIENESNSLSEAKILGVPSVASYVGGVTDRIKHNYDGLIYQHDAPYMLAHYVCEIFENEDLALNLSNNAKMSALSIHNEKENLEKIISIYQEIIN